MRCAVCGKEVLRKMNCDKCGKTLCFDHLWKCVLHPEMQVCLYCCMKCPHLVVYGGRWYCKSSSTESIQIFEDGR